ncbi:MAG: sulfatase/phosphatase domain-containing protein, partial [Spirochaetota bacterium]
SCHDASIRVPLIAAGPGFAPGTIVDELVSLIDVAPTVLSAAGIDTPASMPGRPLQIQAGDGETEPREQVYVQLSESQVGRAIRTHRWKYAVRDFDRDGWTESRGDRYMEDFLYDLEADPYERCNLVYSVDHDGVRTDLATRLKAEATTAGETPFEIVPAVASVREDPQYDYKPGSRRKQ